MKCMQTQSAYTSEHWNKEPMFVNFELLYAFSLNLLYPRVWTDASI